MTVSEKYGTYLTGKECKFVHAVISACKDMPLEHGESTIHEAMSSWDMGTHDLFSMMERLEKCEHITDIVSVPTSGLVIDIQQTLIEQVREYRKLLLTLAMEGADTSLELEKLELLLFDWVGDHR